LRRLASRSGELLGDIDEMIPVLDSKRDRGALMSVATLHRRLESLLVAIAEHRPAGHSAPASTSPR
jgi:hypothetical protein